jgi:glucan phosphoethanolaminetransferase (alkaline phosphatase superfamily)
MTGAAGAMPGVQRAWPVLAVLALLWLAWLAPATVAMLAYAGRYDFGSTLLWPHLAIVSVLLLGLVIVCMAIALLPLGAPLRRLLVSVLLAAAHLVLLCCYVLFFLAWETWNQAASVSVIAAYLPQLPQLLQALPISGVLVAAASMLVVLVVAVPYALASRALVPALAAAGTWLVLHFRGWTGAWRAAVLLTVVLAVPGLLAQAIWNFRATGAALKEPFFLAFVAPGKEVGSMLLDAGSVVRAAREREIAAAYAPGGPLRKKHLVVITVDALRADQMSVYGFSRETTPFLKRLHAGGRLARIEPAYSVCAESFCGLLAVLTSKYWHQATLQSFGLPEVLKRLGYRVSFLLGGDHTNFYGLREAYGKSLDTYRDGSMLDGNRAAGYMNDDMAVLDWLAALQPQAGVPQFVYMHLMSVHTLGTRHAQFRRWQPAEVGLRGLRAGDMIPAYVNNYHNGVLQADAVIERIFGLLRDKGLLEDAVVIITADHGELLGEHGRVGHSRHAPIDPLVRIPLLIYDSEGVRYPPRPMASQVDVAPTLLHRIGAAIPQGWAGEPLDAPARRRYVYMEAGGNRAVVGAAQGSLWKYVEAESGGSGRLFNLTQDPHEAVDVPLQSAPAAAAILRAGLAEAFGGVAAP